MILACTSCEKKYRIDVTKLITDEATFECRVCRTENTVRKPQPSVAPPRRAESTSRPLPQPSVGSDPGLDSAVPDAMEDSWKKSIRLGLRGKMLILFCFVPVVVMAAGAYYYLERMRSLSGMITAESTEVVTQMAETAIAEKARSVAAEMKRYLADHPEVPKEQYNTNPESRAIGIQKVGTTGYTCMVSKEIANGILWIHPVQQLVGVDIADAMKKKLGDKYARWRKLQDDAFATGKEQQGYYTWFDNREKFLTITPVEGTDYFIASTTYLDEFTAPIKEIETRSAAITQTTTRTVLTTGSVLILFVASVAFFFGNRLSGNIRRLTDVAERMSLGDLNEEINIKSKDEIGVLAEAITRMQHSIRISIERLRRRR